MYSILLFSIFIRNNFLTWMLQWHFDQMFNFRNTECPPCWKSNDFHWSVSGRKIKGGNSKIIASSQDPNIYIFVLNPICFILNIRHQYNFFKSKSINLLLWKLSTMLLSLKTWVKTTLRSISICFGHENRFQKCLWQSQKQPSTHGIF